VDRLDLFQTNSREVEAGSGSVAGVSNPGFRRTLVRLKHVHDTVFRSHGLEFQTNSREVEASSRIDSSSGP